MSAIRISTDIPESRQVILNLPPDTPIGRAEIVIHISSSVDEVETPFRTSLADWAEKNAEDWGDEISSDDVSSFTGREF